MGDRSSWACRNQDNMWRRLYEQKYPEQGWFGPTSLVLELYGLSSGSSETETGTLEERKVEMYHTLG